MENPGLVLGLVGLTGLLVIGLLLVWRRRDALGLYRLRVDPAARRAVMETIEDLVLVLDRRNRIVEFSRTAQATWGLSSRSLGATLEVLPEEWATIVDRCQQLSACKEEVAVGSGAARRVYDLSISPLHHPRRREVLGRLILLHDITAHKAVEEQLRWLSRAVEQSSASIIITDVHGDIEYVNPKFTQLTGYGFEEVRGKNPRLLKSGDKSPKAYKELWETILSGHEWRGEFLNRNRDGEAYWEFASISPITNSAGVITHFVAVKEDITARKAAEAALQRYAAELEARNQELDAFAHTVAHDLKNPLSIILGYAELGLSEPDEVSSAYLQSFRIIAQSARRLNAIIEALMLLGGVRKQEVPVTALDMPALVDEAQQRLLEEIDAYHAEIVPVDPDTWPRPLGYGPWVEAVWTNYLSNAIKYGGTPPRVALGGAVDADGMARFWVRDNGQGLDAEAQARLFRPFTRLNPKRSKGHGLGLSIVQRIVTQLGGEVGVDSRPGKGATFYFTLPLTDGD